MTWNEYFTQVRAQFGNQLPTKPSFVLQGEAKPGENVLRWDNPVEIQELDFCGYGIYARLFGSFGKELIHRPGVVSSSYSHEHHDLNSAGRRYWIEMYFLDIQKNFCSEPYEATSIPRVSTPSYAVNLTVPSSQSGNQLPELLIPVLKSLLSAMETFQGRCEGKIFLSDIAMQRIWKGAHEDAVAFVWAHSSAHEECGLIRGLLEAMCLCDQQYSAVNSPSLWQQWRPSLDAARLYIDQNRRQK